MSSTPFCSHCGNRQEEGARFCGSCGTPTGAAGAGPAASGEVPRSVGVDPSAQTSFLTTGPQPGPAVSRPTQQFSPPLQSPPVGPPASAPPAGWSPATPAPASSAPPPAGVPWAGTSGTGSGRDSVDALLGGDWAGAAASAAAALGVMAGLGLVGLLLLGAADAGLHVILSGTAMLVCAALGGDLFAGGGSDPFGAESFDTSASLGALPLTLTFAGLTVLAVLFLRRTRGSSPQELLFQALRTTLLLALFVLVVALVSRVRLDASDDLLGATGRAGASVGSSVVGAVLFGVATLALAVFAGRPAVLPARVRTVRAQFTAPLLAAAAVFVTGLLAALAGLLYTLSTQDDRLEQLGLAVLALPNFALGAVLLTMGVPLAARGGFSAVGADAASGSSSVSLLTLTEGSAWWWFAPVLLAVVLVALAVVVVVRQDTLPSARREALRFAAALSVLAALAALLLRVAGSGYTGLLSTGSGEGSVTFNPVVAALVAGLWGLAAAVVAPQAAAKTSGTLVHRVRSTFGTAASTAPSTTAPPTTAPPTTAPPVTAPPTTAPPAATPSPTSETPPAPPAA